MIIYKNCLKEILKLESKKYRLERKEYLVFGKHIVEESLKWNKVKIILVDDDDLIDYYSQYCEEVYLISQKEKSKFKSLKTIPGIIAVCYFNEENCSLKGTIIGINKLNNPSNLGAILRSAKAFGINNVYIDDGSADLYNPKCVQAMQGVNFSMNIKTGDLYNFCKDKKDLGYELIMTFLDEENTYKNKKKDNDTQKNSIIVVGNEALGLEDRFKLLEHYNYKIEIEYESLNVVVATAIVIYNIVGGLR